MLQRPRWWRCRREASAREARTIAVLQRWSAEHSCATHCIYTKHICFVQCSPMGIVKISDQMHENLRVASNALSRSINAQAEHWMRVGMLAELHPALSHSQICQMLINAEQDGGFDLAAMAQALATPAGSNGRSGSKSVRRVR